MASPEQKAEESLMHALDALRGMIDAQGDKRPVDTSAGGEPTVGNPDALPVLDEIVEPGADVAPPTPAERFAALQAALEAHIERSVAAAAQVLAADLKRQLHEHLQALTGAAPDAGETGPTER